MSKVRRQARHDRRTHRRARHSREVFGMAVNQAPVCVCVGNPNYNGSLSLQCAAGGPRTHHTARANEALYDAVR